MGSLARGLVSAALVIGLQADPQSEGQVGWLAYLITFLAREQVPVASIDIIRIQAYQDAFSDHRRDAVRISDGPCKGGEQVARWYLCKE